MRTCTIGWKEFMEPRVVQAPCIVIDMSSVCTNVSKTLVNKGPLIKVAGVCLIIFIATPDVSFAASEGIGIDAGADKIYKKLLRIAKWVIIFKGGIDTIKSVADGDLSAAKKNFLGYGVTYAILWGLPWMMKEIDKLMADMDT